MSSPSPVITTLSTLQQTLHLLHHRNKNQHRLAKWYKSLSQFRRQIPKLKAEIGAYDAARAIKKESMYVAKAREALMERIVFLRERLVGQWYLAFSNIISDNQWSAIGLMLLGSLARFRCVLNEVGREIGLEEENIKDQEIKPISLPQQEEVKIDMGEVVDRKSLQNSKNREKLSFEVEEVDEEVKVTRMEVIEKSGKEVTKAKKDEKIPMPAKRPKKKRKKGGDAFDDLFDSLM
ncbi:hypothetical protein BGZ60DRAFT_217128 [Tricladium varicosporioides]|nr:hypothetical protein BGZ60DRAFT_217128 [Hymenoscyphus varicosporioides]